MTHKNERVYVHTYVYKRTCESEREREPASSGRRKSAFLQFVRGANAAAEGDAANGGSRRGARGCAREQTRDRARRHIYLMEADTLIDFQYSIRLYRRALLYIAL